MALTFLPNPGQSLNQTRDAIKANFQAIDAAFSVDHVDYNLPMQGEHNKVTFATQPSSPLPALNTNEIAVFNAIPNKSANTLYPVSRSTYELMVYKQNFNASSSPAVIPMTLANFANEGWSYLPSGLLIKWSKSFTADSNTATVITFPVGANTPPFTAIYSVQVASLNGAGNANLCPQLSNITATGFTIYPRQIGSGSGNGPFTYVAIGLGV